MPFIDFPNVPNVPGVPDVARSGVDFDENTLYALASGNPLTILDTLLRPKWEIVDNTDVKRKLLVPDSVLEFTYKNEVRVADFPVQQGQFATYNKVSTPYDIRMKMVCSGNLSTLTPDSIHKVTEPDGKTAWRAGKGFFLDTLETLVNGLTLCAIVTPDTVYKSANLVHYDYHRTSQNGVELLTVDAWFIEVRATVQPVYTSANAAPPAKLGTVTAVPPSVREASLAGKTLSMLKMLRGPISGVLP